MNIKSIFFRQQALSCFRKLISIGFQFYIPSVAMLLAVSCTLFNVNQDIDKFVESPSPLEPSSTWSNTDTPTPIMQSTVTLDPTPTSTLVLERELAFVMQVIDGDTIEVILDGESHRLRYIGIDAPEMGMPFSQEAKELNQRLVENQIVELESDVTETDQHGRLLRYVYLDDGLFVNAELVSLGVAIARAYPPDTKHQELINDKELEAKDAGAGMWSREPATPTISSTGSGILVAIDPECSQFNAPGNDNENKIEEYVCISNIGTAPVLMSEWSVRDEYGWTFQFPVFTLEAGLNVKIITGCGEDTSQELFWCKDETAVWNNDGDCVYLLDEIGELITNYCYEEN